MRSEETGPQGDSDFDRATDPQVAKGAGADFRGKTCFVIMPYGDPAKKRGGGERTERDHFDDVFRLIDGTVRELGIKPLRSDRTPEAVPIHAKMLTDIIDADLAIVDITDRNPNVFYELGVRHTARRHCTILIGAGETRPPFNITGIRVISYSIDTDEEREASRTRLREAIIANLSSRVTDSLVHALLPGLNLSRPQQPLKEHREALGVALTLEGGTLRTATAEEADRLRGRKSGERLFTLGVIKGDLVDVDIVDVWVNPESTRMEMARIHDDSVSAFIRYHGAAKDERGNIVKDLIYDELRGKIGKANVEPGRVIVTGPGDLERVNVKAVFHVAAQHGEPCNGYHTIRSYPAVVSNVLERMDELNARRWSRWRRPFGVQPLRSVIFPLLGTRAQDKDAIEVTESLVREARKYLSLWPETEIRSVYFLAYTKRDLELCEAAFQRLGMPLPTRPGDQSAPADGVGRGASPVG